MFLRRPRVFLSYRHQERSGSPDADAYSALHRAWVEDFAHALGSWNVDVIWDARLWGLFRPHSSIDPSELPFLKEVSLLCVHVSQAFMPIVTKGYLERIAAGADEPGHGTVTEEWRLARDVSSQSQVEVVAILREWPVEGWTQLPEPLTAERCWDYRFVAPARDEVELLGDHLHLNWRVERPSFDIPFVEWISRYLKFCAGPFGLPWPGVERWGSNLDRPRIFLDHCASLAEAGLFPSAEEGSGRHDVDDFWRKWAGRIPTIERDSGGESQREESDAEERGLDERAIALAKSVGGSHLERFKKPIDLAALARSPAQPGLYFGATKPGFSYEHPAEQHRPGFLTRLIGRFIDQKLK
jgi:hypothetical protein